MFEIVKRNGSKEPFNPDKIRVAITNANGDVKDVDKISREDIDKIAISITDVARRCNSPIHVEDVQDMVETHLMSLCKFELAKKYIKYRYTHELIRKANTTDESILSLINFNNKEVMEENSNKAAQVASTQRDLMAGEVSKDLTWRMLLPPDIAEAHREGILHFHDADYFAQRIHNCALINVEDMLQNGTVINGTLIEKPHSFSTACNITTQIMANVASSQYGEQNCRTKTNLTMLMGVA